MAVKAQDCHALSSYYEKGFKGRYGYNAVINRHKAKWGWESMLTGMSMPDVKDLLDYYFTLESNNKHSLDWFFYNYDQIIKSRQEHLDDEAHREKLRRESEQRAKEWRERFGNQGITGPFDNNQGM